MVIFLAEAQTLTAEEQSRLDELQNKLNTVGLEANEKQEFRSLSILKKQEEAGTLNRETAVEEVVVDEEESEETEDDENQNGDPDNGEGDNGEGNTPPDENKSEG